MNGKSTSMVWPSLGSRTAEEQEQANELADKYVQRRDDRTTTQIQRKTLQRIDRAEMKVQS